VEVITVSGRECNKILNGLIVDEHGELILDSSFRYHLDECPSCRAIHDRIQKAKTEEGGSYVSQVMQRLEESCLEILDGLIVDEKGELILEAHFQEHLNECSHCQEVYGQIQAAKLMEVPDYVPGAMQKIREMESPASHIGWLKNLTDSFASIAAFGPRFLVPSAVVVILVAFLVLNFGTDIFSGKSHLDEYVNVASADRSEALGKFVDTDKRLSMALERHLSDQIVLLQDDL
jgi:predicted anti-sigma-YlaC factor YlaD